MTLREYFFEGFEGDEHDLFEYDVELQLAENLLAHVFIKSVFNCDIYDVPKSLVHKVFKLYVASQNYGYEINESSYISGNSLLINHGKKKRILNYNDNFDIENPEEE